MGKDKNIKQEERVRELESPSHRKRRESREALQRVEHVHDLDDLDDLFDDDEVETFQRLKRRRS